MAGVIVGARMSVSGPNRVILAALGFAGAFVFFGAIYLYRTRPGGRFGPPEHDG